jgi:hypothetical protein
MVEDLKLNTPEGGNPPKKDDSKSPVFPSKEDLKKRLRELAQERKKHQRELVKEISLSELGKILSSTIKHDETNKIITFLVMILTYTSEDQMNIAFSAESSAGKSYIPLEIAQYFPQEDVLDRGYVSQKAFFHEWGKFDKELRAIIIDLEKKIIIFIDQPHDQVLHRIRPVLSHDQKLITVKITDRGSKGRLVTKTVVIRGFPTVVFCSANYSLEEQERTRLLLLSPEITQEKLRSSIKLLAKKLADKHKFQEELEANPKRKWLKHRVEAIKTANIEHIIIKEEHMAIIEERFYNDHNYLIPRHQRDFPRLISIIKALALLNFHYRETIGDRHTLLINEEDVEEGYNLYRKIGLSNELGLPPEVFGMWEKVLKPNISDVSGITRKELHYYITNIITSP